jgi:uncharacterized protein YhhL (DUF1145 family)
LQVEVVVVLPQEIQMVVEAVLVVIALMFLVQLLVVEPQLKHL